MNTKKFQKKAENFKCKNCGVSVRGEGYRNHCPTCLWSKHVDVTPGDREEICKGLMRPFQVEFLRGGYVIVHKCQRCKVRRKNKTANDDDIDLIISIAKNDLSRDGRN
ncbi:MAG: hypothetical protein A3G04_04020 [Candidatus Taylorbacteria bacterium RIFCSPLOWO2_12_FULL_44_9]|nr:MAG: hypothetical protein A3G04_04020 [Candidatus Taylorbacteria bacterium RIFCSPLOWO2_12_FULL_44_9]